MSVSMHICISEVQVTGCITPPTNLRLFVSSSARDRASKALRCAVSFAWKNDRKIGKREMRQ